MSQQYTEEETFSIVSSNISSDFIIIGQSADEQGEKDVNGGNGNPQPDLPLAAIETTGKSNLEWQIEALKAQNQMLQEKMKNMELEQKNAKLHETMRKWQLNEGQVDKIAVMAIQQEQNQKEMQELKGKMAEMQTWQHSQHRVDQLSKLIAFQQELHHKEMEELKGKIADMQTWKRSQHSVDELSKLMVIQQEQHQNEMEELKGKSAICSKEFAEKLEIQEKQHKREIAAIKDFINTHVRVRQQQQQQKPQAKCNNPPPESLAIDNNEDNQEIVHLTEKEMQKIKLQGNFGPKKPPYSNISLIAMAIKQNSSKMCTVIEIFGFITTYFDYYKNHSQGILMHNSVRHSLEFNDCFVKVPQMFEHLYGCKWKLHEHCGDLFENQESASNF